MHKRKETTPVLYLLPPDCNVTQLHARFEKVYNRPFSYCIDYRRSERVGPFTRICRPESGLFPHDWWGHRKDHGEGSPRGRFRLFVISRLFN